MQLAALGRRRNSRAVAGRSLTGRAVMMVRTAALRGVYSGKAVWLVTMMPSRSQAVVAR